jgi:CBS domain containing-hemolysin-like protein
VALNGFFVAAEFALVKVRPTQVEPNVARGERRAVVLDHMIHHLDAYLSATQLGITLSSLGLGWIGEPAFAWLLEPLVLRIPGATPVVVHSVSLVAAFTVITVLHIVLGELAPKSLAIRHPKPTSLWTALPLFLFFKVSYPVIWVLNSMANGFLRLFGVRPVSESEMAHSQEELRLILAATTDELSAHKRELLESVFGLSERVARQVMVPRGDVVYLSTERSMAENLRLARTSGHTRYPLARGGLDEVVGIVHIKDLFRRGRPPVTLEHIARPIPFIPETLTLERLLLRMRTEKVHMAAVLDEYGGVSGIITLENVLEEIVGQIQDEFDLEHPELVPLPDGRCSVQGGMLVDELEDALGIEFSERDEDTIAGVVLSELGRRPQVGDVVDLGPLRLTVAEAEGNRIKALVVEVLAAEAVPDGREAGGGP